MAFPSPFSFVNGAEVFANAEVKIWRCGNCHWWREWTEAECPVCGEKHPEKRALSMAGAGTSG